MCVCVFCERFSTFDSLLKKYRTKKIKSNDRKVKSFDQAPLNEMHGDAHNIARLESKIVYNNNMSL